MSTRRLALVLVLASGAALVAMVAVIVATGTTQEAFEYAGDPIAYAQSIVARASSVRLIFAFDIAFIVLYTGFFAALAEYLKRLGQPFTTLALGTLVVTSILDVLENHHILALLGAAENKLPIDPDSLVLQQVLSSTKFTISYIALFLFGLAIPRTTRLGWALCLFLTAGTLASGVLTYAAPPDWRTHLDSSRWTGFLIGFGIAALWLRRAPEPAASSR